MRQIKKAQGIEVGRKEEGRGGVERRSTYQQSEADNSGPVRGGTGLGSRNSHGVGKKKRGHAVNKRRK